MGWIALFFSLLGIWLNGNKDIRCWGVWIASNVFWVIHFTANHEIPGILLNILFGLANVRGWMAWRKPKTVIYPSMVIKNAHKLKRSDTTYEKSV